MGSFTEASFAITLAEDAPLELLSAFAAGRCGEDVPELPELEDLADDDFDADDYLGSWFEREPPPVDTLPVAHQAALWQHLTMYPDNAYFAGTPSTALRWDRYSERWTLTVRALPKEPAEWIQAIVTPLGRWATEGTGGGRKFVGHLIDEYTPEPVLIWSTGHRPFSFTGSFAEA
jgi:hypothetical protein